jgi:hypothetical protein
LKNNGSSCQITQTPPGNNFIAPDNAFAALIVGLGYNGWVDYGGSSWLVQKDMLVGIVGGKGAIATNVSVWWFTPVGEKVVINSFL